MIKLTTASLIALLPLAAHAQRFTAYSQLMECQQSMYVPNPPASYVESTTRVMGYEPAMSNLDWKIAYHDDIAQHTPEADAMYAAADAYNKRHAQQCLEYADKHVRTMDKHFKSLPPEAPIEVVPAW